MRSRTVVAVASVAALIGAPLLTAAPAQAAPPSTVWIEGGVLRYYDTSNLGNAVQLFTGGPDWYQVRDARLPVSAQAPCVAVDAYNVRCPSSGVTRYVFELRGADDLFQNSLALPGTAYGGLGNDYLVGGGGAETLLGNEGNDRLNGRWGPDRLYGGAGVDQASYLDRGPAQPVRVRLDNTLADDGEYAVNEQDLVWPDIENAEGGQGNDVLVGSNGRNLLDGREGNDVLWGLGDNDGLRPGFGKDRVYGGSGSIDYLDYSDRRTGVRVTLGNNTADEGTPPQGGQPGEGDFADPAVEGIVGSPSDDYLVGNNGGNFMNGGSGNDALYGYAGSDVLNGQWGNDTIFGYDGNDRLTGADGNDKLYGMNGNDLVWGDNGADALSGGAGTDYGYGGLGTDTCTFMEFTTGCP